MGEHFKTLSAVMLILERNINGEKQILLQRRKNTGYMDGMWDCGASGHVDADESMKMALIREAKEELGIDILLDDVRFAAMLHRYTPESGAIYYDGYFSVEKYDGEIGIIEPEKCCEIKWFDIDHLPADLIPTRKIGISNYLQQIRYDEEGWRQADE